MDRFMGGSDFELSLADILGFENESDMFNKKAKVSTLLLTVMCALALIADAVNWHLTSMMCAFVNVTMADRLVAGDNA